MTPESRKQLEERKAERDARDAAAAASAASAADAQRAKAELVGKLFAADAMDSEIRQQFPEIAKGDIPKVRARSLCSLINSFPRDTAERLVNELPNCPEGDVYIAILGGANEAELLSFFSGDSLQLAWQLVINYLKEQEASVSESQPELDLSESQEVTTTPSPPAVPPSARAAHSPDFRSVNWFGTVYEFTPNQAACVKMLWEASENGTPSVGDPTILLAAESNSERLSLVFRDHAAWGTLIVEGQTKGTHRLADPPTP